MNACFDPDERRRIARDLAGSYGKRAGALLTSGSAAIEAALHLLDVAIGAAVLVPDNCCHEVPASVLRFGAVPVLVRPRNGLLMEAEDVEACLTDDVQAVIAVHTCGVPCDVESIRRVAGPRVRVIEDAAQAWRLRARGHEMGTFADAVVTSFGADKPMSIGDGGAVFSDDRTVEDLADRWSAPQRMRATSPMTVGMSPYAIPHLAAAIVRADEEVERRRAFVAAITPRLQKAGLNPWQPGPGDVPTWQRLPLLASPAMSERLARSPYDEALEIGRRHPCALADLPMLKGRVRSHADPGAPAPTWLYMKTLFDRPIDADLEAWLAAAC